MDAADSAPSPVLAQDKRRQADAQLEDAQRCMRAAQTPSCIRYWAGEIAWLVGMPR